MAQKTTKQSEAATKGKTKKNLPEKQKDAFDNIIQLLEDYYEGTPPMETKHWTNGE